MTRPHAILCLVSLFLAAPLFAQVSATLSGTVTDQSGALVSAAAVTARSVDTGAERSTVTSGAGRYEFPALPVGNYEIHARKPGFTEEVRKGVRLVVNQSATVTWCCRWESRASRSR